VIESVDVGFGEAPTVGVGGEASAVPGQGAAFDEGASFTPLAETVVFELHEDAAREVIVDLGDIHIAGAEARFAPETIGHLLAGAGRVELVGDVGVGKRPERVSPGCPLLAGEDLDGSLREVARAFLGGDDDRAGSIAFEAAIKDRLACSRNVTASIPNCSLVVPYRCI
jgi:hypothetical protein